MIRILFERDRNEPPGAGSVVCGMVEAPVSGIELAWGYHASHNRFGELAEKFEAFARYLRDEERRYIDAERRQREQVARDKG